MNESETKFDQTFRSKGGICLVTTGWGIPFDYWKDDMRLFLDTARTSEIYLNAPPINFNFIDSPMANATALRALDGEYIIGVNTGFMAVISDVIIRTLANPNFLVHIGDPTRESGDTGIRNYYTDAYKMFTFGTVDYSPYSVPRIQDDVRRKFTFALFSKAISWVVAHEGAHVFDGHLNYLQAIAAQPIIDESNASDQLAIRRALEIEADGTATIVGLQNEIARFVNQTNFPSGHEVFYRNLKEVIYNYSFAVQTCLRILAASSTSTPAQQLMVDHPHPRYRQSRVAYLLDQYVADEYPNLYTDELKYLNIYVMRDIEMIYARITGNQTDLEEAIRQMDGSAEFQQSMASSLTIVRRDLPNYWYYKPF